MVDDETPRYGRSAPSASSAGRRRTFQVSEPRVEGRRLASGTRLRRAHGGGAVLDAWNHSSVSNDVIVHAAAAAAHASTLQPVVSVSVPVPAAVGTAIAPAPLASTGGSANLGVYTRTLSHERQIEPGWHAHKTVASPHHNGAVVHALEAHAGDVLTLMLVPTIAVAAVVYRVRPAFHVVRATL
jgi:hypothetical protein